MKMRKSTWLLLVLALVAIFLVAGCAPTTPPNGEEPNGEEPPPTPPADYCPSIDPNDIKTVVTSLYCGTDETYKEDNGAEASFSILISFDEEIVLLDTNPDNWKVEVDRWVHYKVGTELKKYEPQDIEAKALEVEQVGTNSIRILATVEDDGTNATPNVTLTSPFYGLICGETCYKEFVDLIVVGGEAAAEAIKDFYVDFVSWEYIGTAYPYTDGLGNTCPDACKIKGGVCCTACETCPPAPSTPPCPPGGCI